MKLHDGQLVSYAGADGYEEGFVGDRGKVLVADGEISHVMWSTGSRAGEVTLTSNDVLVAAAAFIGEVEGSLDDSLEVGGLAAFSSRQVWDEVGPVGLLNTMVEGGHLASFLDIAEDALGLVVHRIRHDASFRVITAELDEDEAEKLVRTAAAALIRDAFTADEEED